MKNLMIRKKSIKIYYDLIKPLVEKDIIKVIRYTKNHLDQELPNMELKLNIENINQDKIKRLFLRKK